VLGSITSYVAPEAAGTSAPSITFWKVWPAIEFPSRLVP
jgi:hypothetical protein